MRNKFVYLLSVVIVLISCSAKVPQEVHPETTTLVTEIQKSEGELITGWYYIGTAETGVEKKLKGTSETLFVNPTPIITASNFEDLSIGFDQIGKPMLNIKLDEVGTEKWSVATLKAIDNKLAFIINNKLFYAPFVNSQITGGQTALNGNFSMEELTAIKNKLEEEKAANK